MRWSDIRQLPCSLARTLSVIGDRWTMLILRDAFLGTRRFEDFQKQLGATRHLLADRLRKLSGEGILRRQPYQDNPPRHEYRLTDKGLDLYPVLLALVNWGDRWMAEEGAPMVYEHTTCGKLMKATMCCSCCGEVLDPRQVRPRPGPGLQTHLADGGDALLAAFTSVSEGNLKGNAVDEHKDQGNEIGRTDASI